MAQRYEEFRERSGYNDDKGERRGGGRGTHLFTLPQEVGKIPCCQSCPPVVIADERTEGFLTGSFIGICLIRRICLSSEEGRAKWLRQATHMDQIWVVFHLLSSYTSQKCVHKIWILTEHHNILQVHHLCYLRVFSKSLFELRNIFFENFDLL